eukprot:COSAG03_NODE_2088_length_3143_cov_4.252957_3_plen_468_part_00
MATRKSRRGQAPEFEADPEIARTFRTNLAEARQTIDDVLPAESAQKQRALEAVRDLEESVADAGGDEESLQEGIESLEAFSTSLLLADAGVEADAGASEREIGDAIGDLNQTGADISLAAVDVGTSSDEDSYESALVSPVASEEDTDDESTTSEESLPASDFLAQELQARRGALATASAEEESVRYRAQEVAAERAAERQEEKRKAKQAEEDARKLEQAKAEARKRLMRQRFTELGEEVISPIPRGEVTNPGVSSVVGPDVSPPGTPSFKATVKPAYDGDIVESPSLSLARDEEEPGRISVLGDLTASSDEEVSYPGYGEETEADIDAAIDNVIQQVEASIKATGRSEDEIAGLIVNEVSRKEDMDTIKDRLTDPAQASAFASATRNTPRLLKLIAQGVYAPTAFTGPTGRQAALKIEQDLTFAEATQRKPGTRQSALPVMVRERPLPSNPGIKKWKRPRFTTTTVR